MQVLKDWYARLPDELGAVLAKRGPDAGIKSAEERAELEMEAENNFLREEGWNDQQIRKFRSYSTNPVCEGATSKWSHMPVSS